MKEHGERGRRGSGGRERVGRERGERREIQGSGEGKMKGKKERRGGGGYLIVVNAPDILESKSFKGIHQLLQGT